MGTVGALHFTIVGSWILDNPNKKSMTVDPHTLKKFCFKRSRVRGVSLRKKLH